MTNRKVDVLQYHCRVRGKVQAILITHMCVMSTLRRIEAIEGCTKDFKQRVNRSLQYEIQGRGNMSRLSFLLFEPGHA